MKPTALHVAVGVVRNAQGDILISRRHADAHQGGLWEFPGGKVERGEDILTALRREFLEEVGIEIRSARPLIKIHHCYPDRDVLLDVWHTTDFMGTAMGMEGQEVQWVSSTRLCDFEFPAANAPIIRAACLPERYAILEGRSSGEILDNLSKIIDRGIELLQFRTKNLVSERERPQVYQSVTDVCRRHGIQVLVNSDLHIDIEADHGCHLSSRQLMKTQSRPKCGSWIGASCHNLSELRQAENIGVDFAVLAPVLVTATHPGAPALGWIGFSELVSQVRLPVYALGGLDKNALMTAIHAGGQGIAGISAFLD